MAVNTQLNTSGTPITIAEGGTNASTNTAAINNLVNGAALTAATVATGDLVLIQDISDSNNLKAVTAQSIANLAPSGVTSVSGTANRITSTGGATPVIDIDSAYVGQGSITTVGTVSSGLIQPGAGGTGIVNTGTITVGGNTAFSGAFTFTGTITGNTSVTFPTSGTLATTAGASGIVNSGTANQITYYASTGTTVSGLTGANGSVLVTDNTGVPSMLANPSANGRVFQSANAAIPVWSTSSYADTYAVSTILYASSANTVTGLATTNRAALSTNSTGIPTWLALTDGQIVVGSTAGSPAAATITAGSGITVTNASNSITIASSSGSISGAAKFWLSAAGAGTSINASFNVTSITDTAAGKLGVTIGTDFSSSNWCCNVSITQATLGTKIVYLTAQAAGTCAVESSTGSVATDPTNYFCAGFGDQ